ncbi:MAG TPA: phosphodiester glycosidase family protein [Pyrinomonadaceae bacterium]
MKSEFLFSSSPVSTKRQFVRLWILVSFLGVLYGNSSGQDFTTVHPGVEYAHVDYKLGNDPVKINLLRLDLTKVRLDVHHALDKSIGTETTSSIATRHRAVAAINAGFFRLDRSEFAGDPAGVLIIDGELLSESERGRIAMRVLNANKRTDIFFSHRETFGWFAFGELHSGIKLSGFNRQRKEGEIVLYDRSFGPEAPPSSGGTDLVLKSCKRTIVKKVVSPTCGDIEIVEGATRTSIPNQGYVISLGADDRVSTRALLKDLRLYLARKQKKRTFRIRVEDKLFGGPLQIEDSVAGVPQLIKGGKVDITWEQEKAGKSFVEMRHPRTAVAKLRDGKFLMITVDGRQPGVSVGMDLYELADYLLSLGASDAMNFDGGGSTTMFLDGKVVNTPSDKEGERKVSDAILVTLRK